MTAPRLSALPPPVEDDGHAWVELIRVAARSNAPGVVVQIRDGIRADAWGAILAIVALDAAVSAGGETEAGTLAALGRIRAAAEGSIVELAGTRAARERVRLQ